MAVPVQITGPGGSGKGFSIKTCDPKKTFLIDADGKGPAWAGGRADYNEANKNYYKTSDATKILSLLKGISNSRPDIEVIIVDTINTIMSDKEMSERKKPGYNKWLDLAGEIYDMYSEIPSLRDDLIVVFMAHSMLENPKDPDSKVITKTNGAMLTKLNLMSRLNYNLYTYVEPGDGEKPGLYYFITQSDGNNECRSTYGVLDYKMPNDLGAVVTAIRTKDLGLAA